MVVDMGYGIKVLRRVFIVLGTIAISYLAFKLAIFYTPFLIAFIISSLIEPLIRFVMRKMKLTRKMSSIIIVSVAILLIIGLMVWGIIALINEAYNLLQGLNSYVDTISSWFTNTLGKINFDKITGSEQISKVLENSSTQFLNTVSSFIKNILTGVLTTITSLPTIGVYIVITLLATVFLCMDRLYILDQMEHHLPELWAKKIGMHIKAVLSSLGKYLKAEMTLVLITFIEVTVGLFIMSMLGFGIKYPLIGAIATGFVDALPILGAGSILIPWAIISALNGNMTLAIGLVVLYVIVLVVRQLLEPKVVSLHIGVHPIFTLISMYTGFKLIGVGGLLLGPIVLIILKSIFSNFIDRGVVKVILDKM